jgi:phosphoenolpyruvate synthase/pyruvate phosphate dikinase
MIRGLAAAGVRVPNGFATTADAYRRFIGGGGLAEMINAELVALDTENVEQLVAVGRKIRDAITQQPLPASLEADIRKAYARLAGESGNASEDDVSFAVRSSATAEDLPDASFAGQQETFLFSASTPFSTRSRRCSHPSTTTARSPIESITASSTTRSHSPPGCSGWFVLTSARRG